MARSIEVAKIASIHDATKTRIQWIGGAARQVLTLPVNAAAGQKIVVVRPEYIQNCDSQDRIFSSLRNAPRRPLVTDKQRAETLSVGQHERSITFEKRMTTVGAKLKCQH
jgi:hypothetical protein